MAAPLRLALLATRTTAYSQISAGLHVRSASGSQFRTTWATAAVCFPSTPSYAQQRHVSFFNQICADELWKGVVGVSNAGKKRGRGKRVGRKKVTDLNRGQILGAGKANILWPGLNAPIVKGREVMKQKQLPPNPDRENELVRMRDEMSRIKYQSLPPLQRGWSGNRFPGQSIGAPDPVADYEFKDFDTKVLEFRIVSNMTGTLGRKMSFSAFVVTGNKNGLAGYGAGKAQNGKAAIRVAKNRAAQNLQFVERYNGHTVYHNSYTKYHRTKIFIHKKEEGYGLVCHRALKTICELIGLKDLHCKVEGSTKNIRALTYGFFESLRNQETHQELSDRAGMHVVELSKEREEVPYVVASPSSGLVATKEMIDEEEDLEMDFSRLYYGGKVELQKPPRQPFYSKLPSFWYHKARVHRRRNQGACKIRREAGLG